MSSNKSVLDFEKDIVIIDYGPIRYHWQCPNCDVFETALNIAFLIKFKADHKKDCSHKEEA